MPELADEPFVVEVLDSERVFEGRVWDVRRDRFRYNSDEIVRDYVAHTGAVAVLAMDDDGRVLLIRQYRHPIGMRDWEIPAGLLDIEGEDPLVAAQRELAEEADLDAGSWAVLSDIVTSPGGSDEGIRIYLARDTRPRPDAFARSEEEADIERRWVELDEVVDAVLARRVRNVALTTAVLAARVARDTGFAALGAADARWERRAVRA